jgi:hypothetical protein
MVHNLWRVVLIVVLGVALTSTATADSALPNPAQGLARAESEVVIAIVVVGAVLAVGVTFLVLHQKHKTSAITGCVSSGPGGLSVTEDKNKRIFALSGDLVGLKPGDRMTLTGKRRTGGKSPVFETRSVTDDLGACQT